MACSTNLSLFVSRRSTEPKDHPEQCADRSGDENRVDQHRDEHCGDPGSDHGHREDESSVAVQSQQDNAGPPRSLDILGRIAEMEDSLPVLQTQMATIEDLMRRFTQRVTLAGPMMNAATTTKGKLRVSKQLAQQLDPIANEMVDVSRAFRASMGHWDDTLQAILGFAREYPAWVESSSDTPQRNRRFCRNGQSGN